MNNMTLRDLIEALTRQLDQSMGTAQTNVSGFRRDQYGTIVLQGVLDDVEEERLRSRIDWLEGDLRAAEHREDEAQFLVRDLREKLEWAETEVSRLKLERRALLTS